MPNRRIKIFCSYSHRDEELREELETAMALLRREGVVTMWHDRHIEAGKEWRQQIDDNLETADIVLLLVSQDFLQSDYCFNIEMTRALERQRIDGVRVIPIIMRACDWETATVGDGEEAITLQELQALPLCPPPEGKLLPITSWNNRDEALAAAVKGIRKVVEGMTGSSDSGLKPQLGLTTKPNRVVPGLLPHLCDRARQEQALTSAIREWKRHSKAKRPLVCVIHGNVGECHEMFLRRLTEDTLPRLLRSKSDGEIEAAQPAGELASVESIFVPLRDYYFPVKAPFDFLRSELGRAIMDDIDASAKSIASAIAQCKKPLVFYSYLGSSDWQPDGSKVIEAYFRFWNALPDVSPGPPIVCCLFFKYFGTEELNAAAREYFSSLAVTFSSYRRMTGVVLDELPPVGLRDVENWINSNQYFRNFCPEHTRSFCDIPKAAVSINAMFKTPEAAAYGGKLPMELIVPKLIQVIMDNRC